MKKLFLGLLAVLLLASTASAYDSYGRLTRTSATGLMFHIKTATEPVTYTPTTVVGPGIVMTKLLFSATVAAATTYTVTLWDAPNGITASSGARIVLGPTEFLTPYGPAIWDFTSSKGMRSDQDGVSFKYYPTLVTAGATSPTATIFYQPSSQNKAVTAP